MRTKRIIEALMLVTCAAALLSGCGRTVSASRPANVFGADDREDVTARTYPWSTIGRVDTGCTGTLVGRRLVLTAAHCVYDKANARINGELVYFLPNHIRGANNRSVYVEHVWYGTRDSDGDRGMDWAILLLSEPVGDRYGWLTVTSTDVAAHLPYTVSVAGYSGDRNGGETASVHRDCYVHKVVAPRLLHDCDAASGVSGAAILANYATTGRPEVIGISVSEYRRGQSDSVHAASFSAEVANVGISAASFASVVQSLRDTVDSGLPYREIADVFHAANPNPQNRNR